MLMPCKLVRFKDLNDGLYYDLLWDSFTIANKRNGYSEYPTTDTPNILISAEDILKNVEPMVENILRDWRDAFRIGDRDTQKMLFPAIYTGITLMAEIKVMMVQNSLPVMFYLD